MPSFAAEAALSFLKDTKGKVMWSVRTGGDSEDQRRDAEHIVDESLSP